ncbi:uncharacterized protein LOC123542551 [Mercenaria mercenaria]|uniref:uncharacterized protein LOC123542551 n=1 Tax=Mercenaria mercenaria TaxID=6596 RepID=UPI00234E8C5D|nr:uncharacterized protein LOC123542551 [Mercenaria mercenaria]
MLKFCLICVFVVVRVLEVDAVISFSSVNCTKSPNCSLFNLGSNVVTMEDLQKEIENGVWAMIYYSEFDSKQTYGKCNFKWHVPNENNVVRRQVTCYNFDLEECEDYGQNVKRKVDNCGTAEENGVNAIMDAKFYSQDIFHYFWYDSCYEYDSNNECTVRFLDLMVRKKRVLSKPSFQAVSPYSYRPRNYKKYQPARQYRFRTPAKQVLDLHGLPWDLISADLKNLIDLNIGEDFMKFSWLGPECGFDGKVIQGPYTFY